MRSRVRTDAMKTPTVFDIPVKVVNVPDEGRVYLVPTEQEWIRLRLSGLSKEEIIRRYCAFIRIDHMPEPVS